MPLDWNDFRHFLAVARHQSLAGAARALGVEHTTVSRRLAALERALGVKLFLKTPDGYALTEVGDALLPLAEDGERAFEAAARRALGGDQKVEGRVRLTLSEAFAPFVVRRLPRLRERHPQLAVEVLTGNAALDLARGEADLAIRMLRTEQPELVAKKVGTCGWAPYAAHGYLARAGTPRDLGDLRGHDVIGFHEKLAQTPGGQWLGTNARGASVVLRGDSIVAVMNATLAGMGIGVLPCFLADPEATLRRLDPGLAGTRDIWMVVHPDLARVARVRTVMTFLEAIIAEEARLLAGV